MQGSTDVTVARCGQLLHDKVQQHADTWWLSDQGLAARAEPAGKHQAGVQDQKQYWAKSQPWAYLPVSVFAEAFAMTEQGKQNEALHDEPHYTAAKEAGLDPLNRQKCAHTRNRACHVQIESECCTRLAGTCLLQTLEAEVPLPSACRQGTHANCISVCWFCS